MGIRLANDSQAERVVGLVVQKAMKQKPQVSGRSGSRGGVRLTMGLFMLMGHFKFNRNAQRLYNLYTVSRRHLKSKPPLNVEQQPVDDGLMDTMAELDSLFASTGPPSPGDEPAPLAPRKATLSARIAGESTGLANPSRRASSWYRASRIRVRAPRLSRMCSFSTQTRRSCSGDAK